MHLVKQVMTHNEVLIWVFILFESRPNLFKLSSPLLLTAALRTAHLMFVYDFKNEGMGILSFKSLPCWAVLKSTWKIQKLPGGAPQGWRGGTWWGLSSPSLWKQGVTIDIKFAGPLCLKQLRRNRYLSLPPPEAWYTSSSRSCEVVDVWKMDIINKCTTNIKLSAEKVIREYNIVDCAGHLLRLYSQVALIFFFVRAWV
jgi:hypothetical protein